MPGHLVNMMPDRIDITPHEAIHAAEVIAQWIYICYNKYAKSVNTRIY